jgi:hypothetical protein
MEGRPEVVASLEGARIRIDEGTRSLDECHSGDDRWIVKRCTPGPLAHPSIAGCGLHLTE